MAKKKLLLDFLGDYVHDSKVRCSVLKAERTGLKHYGLNLNQRTTLLTLDKGIIVDAILKEIGVDLDKIQKEVFGGGTTVVGGKTFALASSAAYSQGRIHIRTVHPDALSLNRTTTVVIRGQGFDKAPKIQFQHTSGATVDAKVKKVTCDVDVHQSVTVGVKLDQAGTWTVAARNTATEAWNNLDGMTVTVA